MKSNVCFFTGDIGGDVAPMQQTPQLVAHVDHHDLLAGTGQVGDLALDALGHAGVDGATETTVGGHADDQMLAALVLRGLDIRLLVEGCRRSDAGRQISLTTSRKKIQSCYD